jgi:hypothetical protein
LPETNVSVRPAPGEWSLIMRTKSRSHRSHVRCQNILPVTSSHQSRNDPDVRIG